MPEKKKKKDEYGAESIQVPKGDIDSVRNYPAMYIGSTDEQGWHHLFQEVIDNSIDEAVAGYCSEIKITLSADQKTITVEDNGRGTPIKKSPIKKYRVADKSPLETIFTILHAGSKGPQQEGLKSKAYKTSGGLHGIGVTAVNALSAYLQAKSTRKVIEECPFHLTQLEKHEDDGHPCDIDCPQLKELQEQVAECQNCQEKDKTGIVEFREGKLINSQII